MKFSLNGAQRYSNVELSSIPTDMILKRIGAQLGAVEDYKDWSDDYKNIVVVKIIECTKHPNADKLNICKVADNGITENVDRDENGMVQVVCGAPNVEAGKFAVWIPPGATVPSTLDTDPFVLSTRELRGEVSNGMLASPKELNVSDDHEGILLINENELTTEIKVGESFAEAFDIDDLVVDCENKMFTHRPDCFGNLGIARELAGISGLRFKSPEWYTSMPDYGSLPKSDSDLNFKVTNDIPQLVSRFMAVACANVTSVPSPIWMQSYLTRVGIRPQFATVDITNYVMHFLGQPMHSFDYDKLAKIAGDKPVVLSPRLAIAGEKLVLLNAKTINLAVDDIVIDCCGVPVALAGVMGGLSSEVDSETKNVVIECATFDMYAIRRTSMRHGLFTEAVTRYNKGQSPLQNDRVMHYALKLLNEYTNATVSSEIYDLAAFDLSNDNLNHVEVSADFINSRLGSNISPAEMAELLLNVEFDVVLEGNILNITAPFWRMDISIPEDIVEEIGRLNGFDKIELKLPMRIAKPAQLNKMRSFKNNLRTTLKSLGANEVLTYSFVHGDTMRSSGVDPDKWAYRIRNAISPSLQYYRTSLVPSLLTKVHGNIKAQAGSDNNEFAIYEIGKAHIKDHFEQEEKDLPKQFRRLAFVYAADKKASKNYSGSAYYHARKYLDLITNNQLKFSPLKSNEYPICSSYQLGRSAEIAIKGTDEVIGVIGEFSAKTKKSFKLPDYCAGFEVDIDSLLLSLKPKLYKPLPTYPSTAQDITFEIQGDIEWSRVDMLLNSYIHVESATSSINYLVEPLDIYKQDESNKSRLSFRVSLTHHHKTLQTTEVTKIIDSVSQKICGELNAIRI